MSLTQSSVLSTQSFFLFRVGRDGRLVAVEVAVEPVELPVETFYQVLRLARAREVVILAREDDELGGHAEVLARADNPRIFLERGLDAVHDVRVVLAAPLALDAALKLLAVAGRAARVAVEDGPPARGVDLELVEPVDAVLTCGAAVDAQNQRVLLPLLPAERLDHEAVNVPAVRALVRHALNVGELESRPESLVEAREFPLAAAVEAGRVDVVEGFEVVRGVDNPLAAVVNVNGADSARGLRHLCNLSVLPVNAKQMLLAAHP